MDRNRDVKLFLVIVMSTVVLLLAIMLIIPQYETENEKKYRLQSTDGVIAMYFGDDIVSEYGDIILDNLPFGDREALERGIEFDSKEDAERAVEDFDG